MLGGKKEQVGCQWLVSGEQVFYFKTPEAVAAVMQKCRDRTDAWSTAKPMTAFGAPPLDPRILATLPAAPAEVKIQQFVDKEPSPGSAGSAKIPAVQ